MNIPHEDANPFVALYWGSMLIGRMMGFFVLRVVRPPHVLAGSAVAAMLLIVASILSGGYLAVYTMIAVGLCNSIMFATIFSLSVQGLGRYTTQASGLLSTAIVGGAVISLAQGMVRDSSTWAASFILPLGCYAFIFFYGVEGYKPDAKHTHPPTG